MSNSTASEPTTPLNDRTREWVFRLLYAGSVTDQKPTALTRSVTDHYRLEDDEWNALSDKSPYVADPRLGKIPTTVWDRIEPAVSSALNAIEANMDFLESAVQAASPRWRLDRMPIVDRVLLVLGCFELLIRRAQPVKRVINRTVELAKRYGEADSRRFVNGILDQIRKDHGIEAT